MPVATSSAAQNVEAIVSFFATRLLLKRYRRGNRAADEELPESVIDCEAEFTQLAERVVAAVAAGEALDAMEWLEICSDFSEKWMEVCHWVSPKKFREFLTETIGAAWLREEEIPAARELPPVDLKSYKAYKINEPQEVAQPCLCPACGVRCNSMVQFKTHVHGRAHKAQARLWSRKNGGRVPEPILLPPSSPSNALARRMSGTEGVSSDGQTPSLSPSSPAQALSVVSLSPMQSRQTSFAPLTPAGSHSHLVYDLGQCMATPSCLADEVPCMSVSVSTPAPLDLSLTFTQGVMLGAAAASMAPPPSCTHPSTPGSTTARSTSAASSSEDPTNDDATRVLDAIYPLGMSTDNLKPVDQATHQKLHSLDGLLCRLASLDTSSEAHKAVFARVRSIGVDLAKVVPLHVAHSLVDVATAQESEAGAVSLALCLADEAPGMRTVLGDVVAEVADAGSPDGQGEACTTHEIYTDRRQSRHRGLVRFVAQLVAAAALPSSLLLRCLRTALRHPSHQDVANAFTAVSQPAVFSCLDAFTQHETQALFRDALSTTRLPKYVHLMLTPFVNRQLER